MVCYYCQFKTGSFEILREAAKALYENCTYIQFKQRNEKIDPWKWVTYFMVFTTDCKVFQLSIMHSGDAKGEIKIVRLKQGF